MKTYINKKFNIAFVINPDSKQELLQFDVKDGEILHETEGILKSISGDIAKEIEGFFCIKLSNYNVAIEDENYQFSIEDEK